MRKQLISILLILLFLTSCATLKTERKVVDNTLYSTFPKIKIRVNLDFKYMGKTDKSTSHEHHGSMEARGNPNVKEERHVFVYDKEYSFFKPIIHISFLTLSGLYYWNPDFYRTMKNIKTSGAVKIHGKEYYYAVQVTPEDYFVKYLCRLIGDKRRILIVYIENAGNYNDLLPIEQKGLLKEFLDRSEKNIQILSDDATITGN